MVDECSPLVDRILCSHPEGTSFLGRGVRWREVMGAGLMSSILHQKEIVLGWNILLKVVTHVTRMEPGVCRAQRLVSILF